MALRYKYGKRVAAMIEMFTTRRHRILKSALFPICDLAYVTEGSRHQVFSIRHLRRQHYLFAAQQIHAGLVIPCHNEMFEFNTVSPEEFVAFAEQIGQKYHLLKCGQRLDL